MHTEIRNAAGERLEYTFQPGNAEKRRPGLLVLLAHGVTGNKDRPVLVDSAKALQKAGFDTLRFSFSGNGGSGGSFLDSTITKEVDDLDAVLNAVSCDYGRILYIGHSMGAAVGVLKAARDPRITALVSLAGMVDTRTFATTEFGPPEAHHDCMWEDPDCPLSPTFMRDLCETVDTVLPTAKSIRVPWLLIHGSADDVVLPVDSRSVKASIQGDCSLAIIEGADHSFSDPQHKARQVSELLQWIEARF